MHEPRRAAGGRAALIGLTFAGLAGLASCGSKGASVASPSVLSPASTPTTTPASASPTAAPSATAAPLSAFTGDPFFDPGDAAPGAPGTILRSRTVTTKLANAQVWQVLYWSRTPEDQPVAVSATVVAPAGPGSSPRPILAYAHPTTGLGDQCAPSAGIVAGTGVELVLFPAVLRQGWTVVETDYQGLGTPGDHAYLIGQSEGRNVLDSVRAAEALPGTGSTPRRRWSCGGTPKGAAPRPSRPTSARPTPPTSTWLAPSPARRPTSIRA